MSVLHRVAWHHIIQRGVIARIIHLHLFGSIFMCVFYVSSTRAIIFTNPHPSIKPSQAR